MRNVMKCGIYSWAPRFWFRNLKQLIRNCKFAYQRVTRGYADCDIWDFDSYLSELIINGSKHLADTTHSYPVKLANDEVINDYQKWQEYLYKMASHFEKVNELEWEFANYEEIEKEFTEGMNMLKNSYFSLWD